MIKWQPGITIDEMIEVCVKKALSHFEGNKTKTAGSLGVAIRTLDSYIEKIKARETETEKNNEYHKLLEDANIRRARGMPPTEEDIKILAEEKKKYEESISYIFKNRQRAKEIQQTK